MAFEMNTITTAHQAPMGDGLLNDRRPVFHAERLVYRDIRKCPSYTRE